MKLHVFLSCSFVLFASLPKTADAFQIVFDNGGSGATTLGDSIDNESSGTFSVPGIANLDFSINEVLSDSMNATVNANAPSFGVDRDGSIGMTGDDTDQFDANLDESATFSFSQALSVTEIDFADFDDSESFEFGGVVISFDDLANNTTDVFIFDTPLFLAANEQFTLQATAGSIGLQSITVDISAVPEPTTLVGFSVMGMIVTLGRRKRRVKVC